MISFQVYLPKHLREKIDLIARTATPVLVLTTNILMVGNFPQGVSSIP